MCGVYVYDVYCMCVMCMQMSVMCCVWGCMYEKVRTFRNMCGVRGAMAVKREC